MSGFQLGSWTVAQLQRVRAVAADPADLNEALVEAIDAELEVRADQGPAPIRDLDWSDVEADAARMREEQEPKEKAADLLARLVLNDEEGDFPESLELLSQVLPTELWEGLAERVDACPVHVCDVEICRDDQDPECPAGREAAAR